MSIVFAFIAVLAIIFIVPIAVYGLFTAFFGLKEPDKKLSFFYGILVQKKGTALGFVALMHLGRDYFIENWLLYSVIWFVMFALTEIGQAYMPNYSKKEAVAGIISEAIYFPLAALVAASIL